MWLGEVFERPLAAADLALVRPSGGGWSNDTWIVTITSKERSVAPQRAVVRVQPQRLGMFPDYDLGRQFRVLQALEHEPAVPTPRILAEDIAGGRLGRPAFIMGFVDGRAPSDDRPSFAEAGWLHDATPGQQRTFQLALLDAIAAVHAVDVRASGLGWLQSPEGEAPIVAAISELERTWRFDQGDHAAQDVEHGFVAVAHEAPEPGDAVLLWGDARPANVLCAKAGFNIIALLDWELASVGSPEFDVAWMLEMNWMRMQGAGLEPLPGFLADSAAIAYYEARSGRTLADLRWYRVYAALRVAVLMHRYLRSLVHVAKMPADHAVFRDNVGSRRLGDLLAAH